MISYRRHWLELIIASEVLEALKNLVVSESPGPDQILQIFLKSCSI